MREELLELLSSSADKSNGVDDILIDEEQMVENFGALYKYCPSKCRFQPDDTKVI